MGAKPTYEALEQKVKALEKKALAQKKAQEAVECYVAQLERRHEQVKASVDRLLNEFQEPLDVVTTYLRFVEARYKGRLGSDADAFIASAVDGACRLEALVARMLAHVKRRSRQGDGADDTEYLPE
jgi:light-regulated signal transduction histidine kinase (bacteriophytochrome)